MRSKVLRYDHASLFAALDPTKDNGIKSELPQSFDLARYIKRPLPGATKAAKLSGRAEIIPETGSDKHHPTNRASLGHPN